MLDDSSLPPRWFTGQTCSRRQSRETRAAFQDAAKYAGECLENARLLTPFEAMALALGDSRDKETLYSIARRFADRDQVEFDDLLCDLGEKFPDYA